MSVMAESASMPTRKTILHQLRWRYATKGFDPELKVSEEDWETLMNAAILAPSSWGLQPFKMVVVTDTEMKKRLRPACNNQPQITDCSHLVIFAASKELTEEHIDGFIDLTAKTREMELEELEDFRKLLHDFRKKLETNGTALTWSQRQSYISLGFLLSTSALMGIDACPMEGFQPEKVDEILGLEGYRSTALCALGYRTGNDWLVGLKKVRFPPEEMVISF
ncbi:MAG TPA: NAD(P)H-dependent oxidoreductase [Aridibacter sp.]|nr:NAD(P)H-dependent oxidoreductase [Aridibacter sp.]